MENLKRVALIAMAALLLPLVGNAQVGTGMTGMHATLEQLYDDMMPLCSQLISVGQGVAGFAATWYIASRVWRHIANAEPIDFYPLFRPFVLGFCIMIFPSVLAMINGVMKPTVTATAAMMTGSNKAITELLKMRERAMQQSDSWQMYVGQDGLGDRDKWYKYTHDNESPSEEGMIASLGNDMMFAMSKISFYIQYMIRELMHEVLSLFFQVAAICIDTLRTFQLVVLSILGPFVFGIAVFDGFQQTLSSWFSRYLNIYLWLPVANIFGSIIGKIQEKMIAMDIAQMNEHGSTFFNKTDIAYLAFMIIGIIGYFTVPTVASYIVHAGGSGAFTQKVTNMFGSSTSNVVNSTATHSGNVMQKIGGTISNSLSHQNDAKNTSSSSHMEEKLKGNS